MVIEEGATGSDSNSGADTGAASGSQSGASQGGVSTDQGSGGGADAAAKGLAALATTPVPQAAVGAAAQPPAYTPNLKYKVKGEEKEFPEWLKKQITDAEVEKQARDVFERADGLAEVKSDRERLVQENTAMREQWAPIVQNVQNVVGHLQKGDLDSFFESVNISEAQILKYALHRLQLRENPQQLQAYEQTRQMQLQNQQLQDQLQQSQAGYQDFAVQTRTMQLDAQLQRPEILTVAQAFDQRVGRPGAFRTEVVNRGAMYAGVGKDISAETAVSEVLQIIGGSPQPAGPLAANQGQIAPAGPAAANDPKPTFPVIRGKSGAPVQKAFTSTDAIRQHAKSLRA